MSREFVERRDESFYLIGSRVPLAHSVREVQCGESPEAIRLPYPALSLEPVYGAITFYPGIRNLWKRTLRNASAKRMLSLRRIQRFPTSG